MHTASGGFLTSSNSEDKIQYTIIVDGKEYYLNSSIILDQETANCLYSKALLGTIKIPGDHGAKAGIYSDTVGFLWQSTDSCQLILAAINKVRSSICGLTRAIRMRIIQP